MRNSVGITSNDETIVWTFAQSYKFNGIHYCLIEYLLLLFSKKKKNKIGFYFVYLYQKC